MIGVTPARLTVVPLASAPVLGFSFLVPPGIVTISTLPEFTAQLLHDVPRTSPGGVPDEAPTEALPLVLLIVPLPPSAFGVSAMRRVTVLPETLSTLAVLS